MVYFTKLLFPAVLSFVAASSIDIRRDLSQDVSRREIPSLTAVTVRSAIRKREEAFIPTRDCEHHYADGNAILSGAHSRFATTSMKYKLPVINLEDIELHIYDIQCSISTIVVEFRDPQTMNIAKSTWDNISAFFVISSHPGCNKDGARAPHLVSNITYGKDLPVVMFTVRRVEWKDAYDTMMVKFGTSRDKYRPDSIRLHNDLRRRQLAPTRISNTPPTSTPTEVSIKQHDISHQVSPGQDVFTFSYSNGTIKESVAVSCKNCSITGTIDITEGAFSVDGTGLANFINHGYFEVVTNGLKAHVELDTRLALSSGKSFDQNIATITMPGFQIPDLAAIGPMLELDLTGSITAVASLDVTYGFDITVPDNSSILIDIGNVTQSTYHGFNDAQLTAIPLTVSSPDFSLNLGLGLVTRVVLGVTIFGGKGELSAGMFINMPKLSLSISQIEGVNAECQKVNGSTTVDGFLSHVFPSLTHVVPEAIFDIGFQAQAAVDVGNVDLDIYDHVHTFAGTSLPMPTKCLMWNGKSNGFTAPTTTASTTTSTSRPEGTGDVSPNSNKKTNKGARGVNNPIQEKGGMWLTLGMLLSVLFVAVSL